MIKPVDVKALEAYRIWVKFEDGVEGIYDLAPIMARGKLFKRWEDRCFFEDVVVDGEWRAIVWGDQGDLEICSDMVYMDLTGKTVDELMPVVGSTQNHAGNLSFR